MSVACKNKVYRIRKCTLAEYHSVHAIYFLYLHHIGGCNWHSHTS
ncbi:hypothetical protein Leryth_004196 [Lithospermum erythrorhizon]|nr:hypothetical protein Leryth_004196 [Lithospermum erythrorhizon]